MKIFIAVVIALYHGQILMAHYCTPQGMFTLSCMTSENGQAEFKTSAVFATRFLTCAWLLCWH